MNPSMILSCTCFCFFNHTATTVIYTLSLHDALPIAEVNLISHETEETTTDENLDAWYDASGAENADKCAWQFGQTYTTGNGSTANISVGGRDWLVQMNWVNATVSKKGGPVGCKQGWP